MWWIYKCNSRPGLYPSWGDWNDVFANEGTRRWGSTEWTPRIYDQAKKGDMLIALQSDRNELVGTAKVVGWNKRGEFYDLLIQPMETIRVKVRPLKQDPRIDDIPALKSGVIQALYEISTNDAMRLLKTARAAARISIQQTKGKAVKPPQGSGFGAPEENRRVEKVAIAYVEKFYRRDGWNVENVSKQNRGYDLMCRRNRSTLHVEVKGCRGLSVQFMITANEKKAWMSDRQFILALVTDALNASPILTQFRGAKGYAQFDFHPISFVVKPK
jgi:hypothetical protein